MSNNRVNQIRRPAVGSPGTGLSVLGIRKKVLSLFLVATLVFASALPVFGAEPDIKTRSLGAPAGVFMAPGGELLITDSSNNNIVSLKDGKITVLAGKTLPKDIYGQPADGYLDGALTHSLFASPYQIVPFLKGYAVSDPDNNVLRYIVGDKVQTLAGSGKVGATDGKGTAVSFRKPKGMAVDKEGNLYIADTLNSVIRKMDTSGNVTTYAGDRAEGFKDGSLSQAQFNAPTGLAWSENTLYVTDTGNQRVRVIKDGQVSTLVGSAASFYEGTSIYAGGFIDGYLSTAQICNPSGIAVDSSSGEDIIYIADTGNNAIRKIEKGQISTLAVAKEKDLDIFPGIPTGLFFSKGTLYVADVAGAVYSLSASNLKGGYGGFTDVPLGIWYGEAMQHVCSKGYFTGTTSTTFSPENSMTRGMMVTVLSRVYKGTHSNEDIAGQAKFKDVPGGVYYETPLAWAADKGFVSGTGGGKFSPEAKITREEFSIILHRYAQGVYGDRAMSGQGSLMNYKDGGKVSEIGKPAMEWALGTGILKGKTATTLEPKASLTRAEAAVMLLRFDDKMGAYTVK